MEARLSAALADTARRNLSDTTALPPFRPAGSSSRIKPWLVPALAAAVVIALTVGSLLVLRRQPQSAAPAGGRGTSITLRAHSGGLSAADLAKARQVIKARAMALGAKDPDVRITGPDEITAFLPGVAAGQVGALGTVDAYQVRPFVIMLIGSKSPLLPSGRPPQVIDQWKSLGFAPPKDSVAYRALSPAQQHAVGAVITNWDCHNLPLDRADAPIVTCDPRGGKYLLGPPILTGKDVRSSAVVTPPTPQNPPRTEVSVILSAAGQQRWKAYAAQHNRTLHPADMANLVANLLDYRVAQLYLTDDGTKTGDMVIWSGDSTEKVDATLAANLTGGPLPAPFDLVSVRSN
jgi:preprotein translocase subunit SecD